MPDRAGRRSPRDVDPLSWFTGPLVPFVFGGLTVVYGVATAVVGDRASLDLWIEFAAVLAMAAGFLLIGYLTGSRRDGSVLVLSIAPMALGLLGTGISTVDRLDSGMPVELWWAPVGLAFLVAALAPYLSARRLVGVGIVGILAAAAATVALVTIGSHPGYWPTIVQLMLGAGSVAVATAASAVFSYQVVMRTTLWAESTTGAALSSGVLGEAAKRRILHQELASVRERAVPLLERVAGTGIVTVDDRERARALADDLRAELVERSNRSWLESLARRMNLTVVDSDRRADRMSPAQRLALLGVLRAATEGSSPAAPLLIELRGEPDGSTAVALSNDVTLPEGRRLTLLAPHYVRLRATVDDLEWEPGEKLRLRFRVPPRQPRA